MPQPTEYQPVTSFVSFEAQQSWFPGHQLDAELANLDLTLTETLANLALIQRDDGALANLSVGRDQLTDELWATIQSLTATNAQAVLDALATKIGTNTSLTSAAIGTDALYDTATVGGFFSTFDNKGALKFVLSQAENQSTISGGGFRDLLFLQHQDNDVNDYTAIGQKVSFGIRCYVTGKADGSNYAPQYKDFVGGDFVAIGSTAWSARGVTGVAGSAIQWNVGICDNEFFAENPASADGQSVSMAAVQAIISSKKAASDGSHKARGVLVSNIGKSVTAAFEALSAGTDGDNGQFEYLLRADGATVNLGAIIMPLSASGNAGTRIVYDANDTYEYDRSVNTWSWIVASSAVLNLNGSALYSSTNVGQFANGSAASPTWSFLNSTGAGMYRAAANEVGFSTNSLEAMRVDASQRLIVNHTAAVASQFASFAFTPAFQVISNNGTLLGRYSADASGALMGIAKSRNATKGSHTILNDGDTIGQLTWAGSDGTNFIEAARISATVTGTPGTNDMPGALRFWTTPDGSNTPTERMSIDANGFASHSNGSLGRASPVTKTADFTVATSENWLINNKAGSTCTVTLPAAGTFPGREIMIQTIQAQTVVSNASNVVPLAGGAAATAILAATAGKYAVLVSNGTNWQITQAN